MKKLFRIVLMLGLCANAFAVDNTFNKDDPACVPGHPETSNFYMATNWYLNSPEKVALYNEVFTMGMTHIKDQVKLMKNNSRPWGVVFDIDETLLDNMQYTKKYEILECKNYSWDSLRDFMQMSQSIATPGAVNITCEIQKMGGKVVLVSNRYKDVLAATLKNLNKVGICYNNVLLMDKPHATDKNSRFIAIKDGEYTGLTVSNKKLPPLNIIAYFGDNIQDFPEIHQQTAINADSSFFKQFGTQYFSLPNPIYGSWMKNKGLDIESHVQIAETLPGCVKGIAKSSNLYWAAKWYLYSAEVRAQYNEIFNNAYIKIQNKVTKDKLKSGSWGAVFAIDGTLLNNPSYLRDKAVLECQGVQHNNDWYNSLSSAVAAPGASDVTCNIRKLGGHIVLVTNRDMKADKDVLRATIDSLHKNGICFDKILFASTAQQEKTTRFAKVSSKMNVVAYFGSVMRDFPKANEVKNYNKFGVDYFILPFPLNAY